jgi:hypothetical protein
MRKEDRVQIILRLLDDGNNEYEFPDTEAGRAEALSLRTLMRQEGIGFETSPDNPLVIRVSENGIRFIDWYIREMQNEANNKQDQ